MYSQDKIDVTLKVYHQCGFVTTTIQVLGYPTRRALYTWIANEGVVKPEQKSLKLMNTAEHPRNPSIEVKMDAIHRCFELGESIKSVSEDTSYIRASIYNWRKKYLHRGITALMNDKNIKPNHLTEGSVSKKGCSPDNGVCEGLFGRLKNGMFYYQDWTGVKVSEFIDNLNEYLLWYNTKRIKTSPGNMSPWEYRQSCSLVA